MGDSEPGSIFRDPQRVNHSTRKEGYNMMKKYRNTKTGVEISTPCDISGENWEPVKGKKKTAPPEAEREPEKETVPPQETAAPANATVIGPAPETEKSNE